MRIQPTDLTFWVAITLTSVIAAQTPAATPGLVKILTANSWQYSCTLHKETGTITHRSAAGVSQTIVFKPDSIFEQVLDGKVTTGVWHFEEANKLHFKFRKGQLFEVAEAAADKLVLEFTQPNAKGVFQYHFTGQTAKSVAAKPSFDKQFSKPERQFSSGFVGFLGISTGGSSLFLNIGGPTLRYSMGKIGIGLSMLPSLRVRMEENVPENKTTVSGVLGFSPFVAYKRLSLLLPFYVMSYDSKDKITPTFGLAWRFGR